MVKMKNKIYNKIFNKIVVLSKRLDTLNITLDRKDVHHDLVVLFTPLKIECSSQIDYLNNLLSNKEKLNIESEILYTKIKKNKLRSEYKKYDLHVDKLYVLIDLEKLYDNYIELLVEIN